MQLRCVLSAAHAAKHPFSWVVLSGTAKSLRAALPAGARCSVAHQNMVTRSLQIAVGTAYLRAHSYAHAHVPLGFPAHTGVCGHLLRSAGLDNSLACRVGLRSVFANCMSVRRCVALSRHVQYSAGLITCPREQLRLAVCLTAAHIPGIRPGEDTRDAHHSVRASYRANVDKDVTSSFYVVVYLQS